MIMCATCLTCWLFGLKVFASATLVFLIGRVPPVGSLTAACIRHKCSLSRWQMNTGCK